MNKADSTVVAEGTRSGHEWAAIRTESNKWTGGSDDFEIVGSVDGKNVITAGALSVDGWSEEKSVDAVRRYCEAYIDGLEA